VRLSVLLTIVACCLLRAEDPWIGSWKVVWASASFDGEDRLTISQTPEGLQFVETGQPERILRRVAEHTDEYSFVHEDHTDRVRCSISADGLELTMTWKARNGRETVAVFDRFGGTPAGAEPRIGEWMYNQPKSTIRTAAVMTFKPSVEGTLSYQGGAAAYTAAFDGTGHPIKGHWKARTVTLKRIDDRTFEETLRDANGDEVQVRRIAASGDGKELTFVVTGTFPVGRGHRKVILRKQAPSQ
jgi:hypothetical protein